jgi:DHA1 family purine ribonucleoside efflux pump-like MFS transporter
MRPSRLGFAAVTGGYLATTTAESLLAPAYPLIARDLGASAGFAGVAFGVLTSATAVGGLAGGFVLARLGARAGLLPSLALVATGALLSAAAGGRVSLLAAQVVLGLGSGVYFASGIRSAATLAGRRRRGLAIGVFGVAFSAGLGIAGLLAALGDVWGWRASFVAAGVIALASLLTVLPVRVDVPVAARSGNPFRGLHQLRLPVTVGGVASASQYGTVAFVPLYAVQSWHLSPASAALLIVAARVLSVPAKLLSGNASDGAGALRMARRMAAILTALGACWTLIPVTVAAAAAAVLFATVVSALGPVGNVLALERLEGRPELLGAFRSVQIGLGAAAAALLGLAGSLVGLDVSLVVAAVAVPALLVVLGRPVAAPQSSPSAVSR